MTYDTGEHNNVPYKISISSKNVTDDHVRQHFEKGLSALLADPYFLLLYVPENGDKMQIVQPAKDSYHQKRIEKMINEAKGIPSFYYALSHLWKITENNRHLWEEIGEYVNDLGGKPAAAVSMRAEKRDTLLGLLKDHPDSYWWIDVLCARSDTPLDIMGDIYSCCLECIAMIDCEPNLLSRLHTEENTTKGFIDRDFTICSSNGSSSDFLLHCKQIYEKYPELIDDLSALYESEWWERVWTLQEMALPFGIVHLIAETDIGRLQSNKITLDGVLNSFKNAMDAFVDMKYRNEYEHPMYGVLHDRMAEISYSRAFKKHDGKMTPAYEFLSLMLSLAESTRRCMDPVDYVYGVLGILQIKIPRMTDPEKVWQRFLSELDDYLDRAGFKKKDIHDHDGSKTKIIGIREYAHKIDLTTAECMGDVYGHLLDMEEE